MPRGEGVACPWVPTGAKMVIRGTDLLSLHQRPRDGFLGEERVKGTRILFCYLCHKFLGKEGELSLERVLPNKSMIERVQNIGEERASHFCIFITTFYLLPMFIFCKSPASLNH